MALEVVGGAFLSSVFQTLFDKIASSDVISFFRRKKLNQGLLRTLKIRLLSVSAVLDDAETKQLGNPLVREWLHDLKAATFDAEDLMIEIGDESLRCEMEEGESSSRPREVIHNLQSMFSSNALVTEIESEIEEILDRLKFLLDQADALGLKKDVQNRPSSHSQRSLATSLVEESGVYGRDAEKRKIVELLMSSDACDDISVIPIVGMGGIGKTTLAGLVYNDDQVQKHFDVKAWVTVSDDFSVARVTKTILEHVTTSQAWDLGDLDRLQVELKEALRGKKFFFVLDDIWDESYGKWDGLRRAFESGVKGSKIIVTTRSTTIATMMANVSPYQLMVISDEDCLQLFIKHAIKGKVSLDSDPNLKVLCSEVVKRCKGLPLAVKSLAGLLRSQPNLAEWEKILKNDIWELPNEKVEIIPALWLSYHYLPSHLKRCFAYCAIFPHDYPFGKQELILLWVAENLLPGQKGKMLEEVGEEYFNDLVSRSIFQKSQYYWGKQEPFTMHDLVSDLAKFIFGKFCTSLEDNDSDTSTSNIIRHFSFKKENFCGPKMLEALSQAKSLRTILALPRADGRFRYTDLSWQPNFLFTVLCLRVLSLSEYPSRELPDSIGDLKHLRYLDLSSSKLKSLPDTMCNLYNLQMLLLSWCRNLSQLPTKIGSLINLRHLDVSETCLKGLPTEIGSLINLRHLDATGTPLEGLPTEIGSLINLRHLDVSKTRLKGLPTEIGSLINLRHLDVLMTPLEGLPTEIVSLINLRHLDVTGTPLKDMPKDLGNLKNLQFLSDFVVVGEESGSNIQQLKKLHRLRGKLCISGLQYTGDIAHVSESILEDKYLDELFLEWNGGSNNLERERVLFDRLRPHATLKNLRIFGYGGERFSEWLGDISFSNITTMSLRYCENCSSLPSFGQLPSLKELEISGFAKLEKIGEEFFGNGSTPFRSLKTLSISNMSHWKEWSFSRAEGVGGVFPCLTRLEILECQQLVRLVSGAPQHETHTPFPSLEFIRIFFCPRLESFLEWGSFSRLESIEFYNCEKLLELRMQWDLQRFTSLRELHLRDCDDAVDSFPEEGLLPTTLTSLFIRSFDNLKALNGKGLRQLTSLEHLEIIECKKLECLPEEGLPNSLSFLSIFGGGSSLKERCQREIGEDWPKIAHISHVLIDWRKTQLLKWKM